MNNDKYILLVEDNLDDIELTLRAFKKNNILNEVIVAQDGERALNLLLGFDSQEAPAELPAVILLDLKLPKVDGLGVLQQLRAHPRTRLLPVVVLTCSKEDQDMIQSYSLGANSYVRKPVDFQAFLKAVHQLGLYWLLLNEAPPEMRNSHAQTN